MALTKRLQIRGESIQFLVAQLHCWHQRSWLDDVRILNPLPEVLWRVGRHSGGNRVSAHQVGQVGPKAAIGRGPRHGVAVDAGGRLEYSLALRSSIAHGCVLALLLNPAIEIGTWLNVNAEQHLGVLRSAVLRTLPKVNARLMRIDPHTIGMVGNQVGLAGEARDPEAVVRIRRQQRDQCRNRVVGVAHRNMEFIRSHDSERRVSVLPPELVSDGDDFDDILRSSGLLNAGNYSRRCHEQRHNNEDGDHGPGELHLVAAIHLGRFASIVILSLPELNNGVEQQGEDD